MARNIVIRNQLYCPIISGVPGEPTFLPDTVKRGGISLDFSPDKNYFLPYEPGDPPTFDEDTQKLTFVRVIENSKVVNEYTVVALDVSEGVSKKDEVRQRKIERVTSKRDELLSAGFDYDFGAPTGVKNFQTRESDRINWLALHAMALTLVSQGNPNRAMQMRDANNVVVDTKASVVVDALFKMGKRLSDIYATSWTHKDALRGFATIAEIRNYNINAGWPN